MTWVLSCCAILAIQASVILVSSAARTKHECKLHLTNGDSEKNQPIFMQNNSSFITPKQGYIYVTTGKNITMTCPDHKNYITKTHSNFTTSVCVQNSTLRVGKTNINFEEFQCKHIIRGIVQENSRKHCARSLGHVYDIGYKLPVGKLHALISVCYDDYEGNVLYTEHKLYPEVYKYGSKTKYRPDFSTEGLPSGVSASVAYKQAYQKSTLNQLLKSANLAEKYINDKSYLARGHLSPDADFLLAPYQYTTFYYINTVPQWQAINNANWKKLESTVRKTAADLNQIVRVYTGSHDILQLEDANKDLQSIYLVSREKLPVPKYIWKIIYAPKPKEAIVLIILNNPFLDNVVDSDLLCDDICGNYGWGFAESSNISKGYVHCCEYQDFVKVVRTVPNITVSGILSRNP